MTLGQLKDLIEGLERDFGLTTPILVASASSWVPHADATIVGVYAPASAAGPIVFVFERGGRRIVTGRAKRIAGGAYAAALFAAVVFELAGFLVVGTVAAVGALALGFIYVVAFGLSDLIGPERSEGPPLAPSARHGRRERGHAGNTPARCDLSTLAAPAASAPAPATGAPAARDDSAGYEGGRTA